MKKYITLAALLAAGTACANAGTENIVLGGTTYTATDVSFALVGNNSGNYGENDEDGVFLKNGRATIDMASDIADDWLVSFTVTSDSALQVVFSTSTKNSSTEGEFGGYNIYYKEGSLALRNGSTQIGDANENVGSSATCYLWCYDEVLTLGYKSESGDIVTVASTGSIADGVTLKASDSAIAAEVAKFWTAGGKNTFSNINVQTLVAVPEPSAFGMLAGLGALALVASRRRRK